MNKIDIGQGMAAFTRNGFPTYRKDSMNAVSIGF